VSHQDNKEIEIKLKIDNLEELEHLINQAGAVLVHPEVLQRTIRFDTPEQDLEKKGVFLRVRTGEKSIMTVKKKIDKTETRYFERNEWETEISDSKMAEEMLKNLGFEKILIMEKYRKTYSLDGVWLSIDRLPFGNFIEIEGAKDDIDRMVELLKLKTAVPITVTYWDLHDEYNREHHLTEENIVFN